MPQSKWCSRCKLWKLLIEFWRDTSMKDGLKQYCKSCWNEIAREGRLKHKRANRQHYTDLERRRYHRIQDEAGCHSALCDFYPAYRLLRALETAEVVEV